jgi:hypothetical protein
VSVGLVNLALFSDTLDDTPTWVGVDGNVISWSVDRGRTFETDETQTGVAEVTLVDAAGLFDVLNGLSPNAGHIKPLRQIQIKEVNPVTSATVTQFTGFIEDWDYTVDEAERQLTIVLSCVDGFDILANAEVVPNETGAAVYARQQVDDAQRARLADAGWPSAKTDIFTGNVYVKPVIYQAGTDILTTLSECVKAEFPGVANHFMSKTGDYTFHGRKARFNPSDPTYNIATWLCGDKAGQAGHSSWGKIAELAWRNAKDKIVNACIALPEGVAAADVAGQLFIDSASIAEFGVRSLKYDGLLNDGNVNTGGTDLEDTLLIAKYYVDNFAQPLPQIVRLTFQSVDPADATNAGTWAILCGVEIGDLISLVTVNPGGGGFNADFFVEGVHQRAEVGNSRFAKRTLTLDVSPRALYDTNPFPGTDT